MYQLFQIVLTGHASEAFHLQPSYGHFRSLSQNPARMRRIYIHNFELLSTHLNRK